MRWASLLLLLLCVGCTSARPLYWKPGPVYTTCLKGLNGVITHDLTMSLAEIRARCKIAADAHTDFLRLDWSAWAQRNPALRERQLAIHRIIEDSGMQIMMILYPDGADTIGQWRQFVSQVVGDFRPCWFEVCNEPDNDQHWPPERYAKWLSVAYDEIKRQQPFAVVCAPGLGHGKFYSMEDYLRALPPDKFDVLTIHPYERGWPYVRRAMELVPNTPVILSEDGAK